MYHKNEKLKHFQYSEFHRKEKNNYLFNKNKIKKNRVNLLSEI